MILAGTGPIEWDRDGLPFRRLLRKAAQRPSPEIHGYLRWNVTRWALGEPPKVYLGSYADLTIGVNGAWFRGESNIIWKEWIMTCAEHCSECTYPLPGHDWACSHAPFAYLVTVELGPNDKPSASAREDIMEAIRDRLDNLDSSIRARARIYYTRIGVHEYLGGPVPK